MMIKRFFCTILLIGTLFEVDAQQTFSIHVESEIGDGVELLKEWPKGTLVKTATLDNGKTTLDVAGDSLRIYAVRISKSYKSISFIGGEGDIKIQVPEEGEIILKGGKLETEVQEFEKKLRPIEKKWSEIGRSYSETNDLDKKVALQEKTNKFFQKVRAAKLEFVKSNADNIAGAWIAEKNLYMWAPEDVPYLIKLLNGSSSAKFVLNKLRTKEKELNKSNMVGKQAPDFALEAYNGGEIQLDSLLRENEYVLIDFWASWCAPCRAANRKIAPYYSELKKKGLEIISISVDEDKESWKKAVQSDKIGWLQVIDPHSLDGELTKMFHVQSLPSTFLLNKKGKIIKQRIGLDELKGIFK